MIFFILVTAFVRRLQCSSPLLTQTHLPYISLDHQFKYPHANQFRVNNDLSSLEFEYSSQKESMCSKERRCTIPSQSTGDLYAWLSLKPFLQQQLSHFGVELDLVLSGTVSVVQLASLCRCQLTLASDAEAAMTSLTLRLFHRRQRFSTDCSPKI